MFARVTHVQAKPGKLGDIVALYQEAVMPVLQQMPGFKGSFLLSDPATGKGMSITLWNADADRRAGDSDGALRAQIAGVMPLLAAPPVPESFDALTLD